MEGLNSIFLYMLFEDGTARLWMRNKALSFSGCFSCNSHDFFSRFVQHFDVELWNMFSPHPALHHRFGCVTNLSYLPYDQVSFVLELLNYFVHISTIEVLILKNHFFLIGTDPVVCCASSCPCFQTRPRLECFRLHQSKGLRNAL